ncbi:LytTR family transcriptional regulator DNA-binding domain-containing protein [Cytobacillus sp. IB215665]|uniref:LytTR family transcriptional regulator DNA-binding domain-containing protein n=1 Tax=Cytobacillus sp. IB215665 TaxID=3097357 RepID=UPI002A1831E8|nr:LytTR family transcriptional regulator DNA-binding domain-containing protein [Cytobacillus sp. IB215665]MDX8365983.1 LytTR family transcriptional regulator DNA-binding domain-containing protein [Cytobacillus sp. IB215665]
MGILSVKKLERNIGNTVLFPPIDLTIHNGDIVAIQCNIEVGGQFIQILTDRLPKSGGEINYFEKPFIGNFKNISPNIGVLLSDDGYYERLTPKQYLQFIKRLYNVDGDIEVIIKMVGLIDKQNTKIDKLSFSEKKRLQIARVILQDPQFFIMEEPTQNVDIESKMIVKRIIEELAEQGKAILLTTSDLENAIIMTNCVYRLNGEGLKKIDVADGEDVKKEIIKNNNRTSNNKAASNAEMTEKNIQDVEEDQVINTQVRFEKIPAKVNEKIILFDPTEIDFIESNDGIAHLHVKGETFACSYTLNELFDRLYPFGFFRCHRSYIVNLQKVREVITWTRNSYSLILDDAKKSSIPLSKGKLNDLKGIIGI